MIAEEHDTTRTPNRVALGERFELQARVGASRTGELYRAHDQWLGRTVMMKACVDSLSGACRDDFFREASFHAATSHPGLAPVHDVFEDHAGTLWMVLEHADSVTLGEVLHARHVAGEPQSVNPMPLLHVVMLHDQVLQAVAHLHDLGITHRNLAPATVSLTPEGRVLVDDLSLARAASEPVGVGPLAPHFASPELRAGQPVDQRGDVYALGALFFACSTGAPPAANENRPCAAQSAPVLPPWVDLFLERALAQDPSQRYADAGVMLDELRLYQRAFHGEPPVGPHVGAMMTTIVSATARVRDVREEHADLPTGHSFANGEATEASSQPSEPPRQQTTSAQSAGASAAPNARPSDTGAVTVAQAEFNGDATSSFYPCSYAPNDLNPSEPASDTGLRAHARLLGLPMPLPRIIDVRDHAVGLQRTSISAPNDSREGPAPLRPYPASVRATEMAHSGRGILGALRRRAWR